MANDTVTTEADPRRVRLFFKQFNWRMVLVRVLVNGLSLLAAAALLPHVYLPEWTLINILFLGAILGILNAVVRPVLQFLTLSFIFVTYGLVVVMINTVILLLLAALFPGRFGVDSLFWATVAGAVMGILSAVLESLLGLRLPILPDGSHPSAGTIPAEGQPVALQALIGTPATLPGETAEGAVLGGEPTPEPVQTDISQATEPASPPAITAENSAEAGPARDQQAESAPGARKEES